MAWTSPRTWVAGELVTAALMNTHVRDNLNYLNAQHKYKASDETVANTTLQNDNDLFFTSATGEVWLVDAHLLLDSNSTAGFKCTWTVASGTMKWGTLSYNSSERWWIVDSVSGSHALLNASASTATSSPAAGVIWGLSMRGIVQNCSGTVQFQWAQNVTNGSTIVKAGSLMIATRVST